MSRKPRPIRIEGDVAYVPLTRGYEAVIDAADVPFVDGRNWCAIPNRKTVYAVRAEVGRRGRHIHMHRTLLGFPSGFLIDHINGNGLDNRRSNLRLATPAQNQFNRGKTKNNSSGFKGVSRSGDKWRAQIRVGGRLKHLGIFKTKIEAAAAYERASAQFHGEFGRVA